MTEPTPSPYVPGLFEVVPMPADIQTLPLPAMPYYVVDRDGFFVHRTTKLGRVLVRLKDKPTDIPKYDYSGFLWPDIKPIPIELLGKAWSFFRAALETHHSEAIVLILLHDNGEYDFFVPPQEADHTGVSYAFDATDLPRDAMLVGTIHSHCDFSAFHSGTDETDAAKHDGLHMTFGHVDQEQPEVDVMMSFNGLMWKDRYKLTDVTTDEPMPLTPHPAEWLDRISQPPARTVTVYPLAGNGQSDYRGGKPTTSYWGNWGMWEDEEEDDWDGVRAYYESLGKSINTIEPQDISLAIDNSYSYEPGLAAAQMEYDLDNLKRIASRRGLNLRFTITAHGEGSLPLALG